MNEFEIRHDIIGYYICTIAEGEHEDEGHPSVGFDGRDHYPTLEAAQAALAKRYRTGIKR